ncbi:unnamed protein product [Leuciscus chuanchicus]
MFPRRARHRSCLIGSQPGWGRDPGNKLATAAIELYGRQIPLVPGEPASAPARPSIPGHIETADGNGKGRRGMCTAALSSTILQKPNVVEEPKSTGCWAQVASITDAHNYRGREQGWAERAKHKHCLDHRRRRRGRAGKSNVTIPPNRRRVILGPR